MGAFGLLLLALALVLMMSTGWPTYAVLLGVCSIGALAGLAAGVVQPHMLLGLPDRVIGLLNYDLLQALVIYGLVGALLIRLDLAGSVYGGLRHTLRPLLPRAAAPVSGLMLGALLAPINGSVGASLMTLNRSMASTWAAEGMPPARRTALVAVASTLGVLIPPSLVLLLLGDAMLRAHTEGLDIARAMSLPLAGERLRVINTQDVMQAVLPPAALLLIGWLTLSAFAARHDGAPADRAGTSRRERAALVVVPAALLLLLTLLASGRVRAVEGAATAGVALLAWGGLSRQLTLRGLAAVLSDAMVITGVLFALLLAATTFSLLLRLLGTDRLVTDVMVNLGGGPRLAVLLSLGVLLLCAFVLDAFELTFLVIPIVMPPLLSRVGDAAWVSALVLLVLQLGFLLPPFGYSVVLARGHGAVRPPWAALNRELLPYLLWLLAVIALLFAWPLPTHWLQTAPTQLPARDAMNADRIDELMREMSRPRDARAP